VIALLNRNAKWLCQKLAATTQLLMWVAIFWLCVPLYPFGFVLFFTGAPAYFEWGLLFVYWLSVGALHLTAMTGITAAETLVETRPDEEL
jgi:hypothetical protein